MFLSCLIMVGCSSNDDEYNEPQANREEIRFKMGFAGENDNRLKVTTDVWGSFTSSWQNGDKIGVYIVKGGASLQASGNYADNVLFTYSGGTCITTTPLYYPNDGDNLSFYAYYPYDAAMSNPNVYTFNVPLDQTSNNGEYYEKNDFLWAKLENVSKSDNAVALQFSHALAMIYLTRYEPAYNTPIINLLDAITDCTINLKNQNITPGSTKNSIKIWIGLVNNGHTNYYGLVPPQTMDIRFVWTKNNIPYTVTPATNVTLTSGNIKKYSTTQP